MDTGTLILFGSLFSLGLLGFLGWAIYWRAKKTELTEKEGKKKVQRAIDRVNTPQIVINDYRIKRNTFTADIDHVVINAYGIFVVHVLPYAGKITGNKNENEWLQTKNDGTVNGFFNPVLQNEAHVRLLASLLPKDAPIKSVVVLANNIVSEIDKTAVEITTPAKVGKALTSGKRVLNKNQINEFARILREKEKNM